MSFKELEDILYNENWLAFKSILKESKIEKMLQEKIQSLLSEINSGKSSFNFLHEMIQDQLILCKNDKFAISARYRTYLEGDIQRKSIMVYPNDVILLAIGPGKLQVDTYDLNTSYEELGYNDQISHIKREAIQHLDILEIKAGKTAIDAKVESGDLLLLEIASMPKYPLTWFFDYQTKKAIYSTPSTVKSSRILNCLKVIDTIGLQHHSSEALLNLTNHSDFFIRWESLKRLCKVCNNKAKSAIQSLKNDTNYYIREAISKLTL